MEWARGGKINKILKRAGTASLILFKSHVKLYKLNIVLKSNI